VAEPGKVARNAAAFRLPLDGVIVLADAEQLPEQIANRYTGRSVIAQLRQADLVVINKIDLVDADRLSETRSVVERHAPGATIVMTERARLPLAVLFGARPPGKEDEEPGAHEHHAHHSGSYDAGLVERAAMSREAFETVARELSSGTIRAKGYVALTDAPDVRYLYQQVGRRWTLVEDGAWDAREPATRIVTIAVRAMVPEN
jgi:G3E family GTPase